MKFITLLPPPNITGSLHIGHYFNWLLQDFLIQYKKNKGFKTEWILGLDHAGIATQYVVEKKISEKGLTRIEVGKEKFNELILEWKKEAEKLIQEQVNNFKFDMNWNEKHFTMEEEHQNRVKDAFIKFYNDGLIKKNKRITNWDPKIQTAISDLEVIEKMEKSTLYLVEYKSADGGNPIWVATTRPETIFADVALCLNPEDERADTLKNKKFLVPIIGRVIPLVLDKLCEKNKGLGVLKVTPAHDNVDYEIAENHGLEAISIINKDGTLYNTIPELNGLSTQQARKKIIEIFKEKGIKCEEKEWEGIKKYTEKSGVPVETILTEQWFLDVKKMAQEALEKSKETKFYPEYLKNTFEYWLNNIKPWCISRQIWWGHQIPIWYTEKGEIICAKSQEEAKKKAGGQNINQETDVLDTWFSSALWANLIEEQIDVLVTGKDILFFWVARMVMFSLYLYKKQPFKTIYFNGIVRDRNNEKMSKTKGNVINPVEINKQYGDDALRFTLLRNTTGNRDIKLNEKEVELSRNFITKIRNANTFLTNYMSSNYNENVNLDNWIENEILNYKKEIDQKIEEYEFQKAAELFYELVWNSFCNWYIEGLKENPSSKAKDYFQHVLLIGQPFLPLTTKTFQFQPSIEKITKLEKKPTQFNKIIKVSKFLRKIKKTAQIKSFFTTFEPKLIEKYTNIKNNKTENAAAIKMDGIQIWLEKEVIKQAKNSLKKEITILEKEINYTIEKVNLGHNVPKTVKEEWNNRIKEKQNVLKELKEWQTQVDD